ncbi:7-carboxy-7-deazaguanine synthase QueE [Heliophilum fasciatum]|uniref:7-carboxy-7-deazaguanine synthase n=1 Tax=Heliophilum fasciatum TaxID=35700 RepID=A0A4R2RHG2_9FIRM|nr:7-carboxy-7-deazaguanine synthase QueE [Heliophilum fasciatum]MCW2278925.1 organic radical activating enzyme [Heliophilum fasciatum]TCP62058.1 organic radical activating enzyme [Heliophilum fasciatum]
MSEIKAQIMDIMVSAQGEGPWVGHRQLFLRFFGCNLHCSYCDTPASQSEQPGPCQIERQPGSAVFDYLPNPLSVTHLAAQIRPLLNRSLHSISLTGGEPLLHVPFIRELADVLGAERPLFYLETNGTLVDALKEVLPVIDFISMDLKMPSHCTGLLWEYHSRFLRVAAQKPGYVKTVVLPSTTHDDIEQAARLVKAEASHYPLILQPVSDKRGIPLVPGNRLLEFQDAAMVWHQDVRVIPQTHKWLEIL